MHKGTTCAGAGGYAELLFADAEALSRSLPGRINSLLQTRMPLRRLIGLENGQGSMYDADCRPIGDYVILDHLAHGHVTPLSVVI